MACARCATRSAWPATASWCLPARFFSFCSASWWSICNIVEMKTPFVELPITTSDGIFLAHYSEKGLAELDFPNTDGLVAPKNTTRGRAVNSKQVPLQI